MQVYDHEHAHGNVSLEPHLIRETTIAILPSDIYSNYETLHATYTSFPIIHFIYTHRLLISDKNRIIRFLQFRCERV